MTDKNKRKVNPRRQLLIRLLLGITIIVVLIPFVLKQFEPEHLYLVYESYDEETFAPNLYLYDATLGETVRQITDNSLGHYIAFDTAENSPYLVYQYLSSEPQIAPVFVDLDSGNSTNIGIAGYPLRTNFELRPDGQYLVYQIGNEGTILSYLQNIGTGEEKLIHEFEYGNEVHQSLLYWAGMRLFLIYKIHLSDHDSEISIFEYDIASGDSSLMVNMNLEAFELPVISHDGNHLGYRYREFDVESVSHNVVEISNLDGSDPMIQTFEVDDMYSTSYEQLPVSWHPNNRDLLISWNFSSPIPEMDNDLFVNYSSHLALLNTETDNLEFLSNDTNYSHHEAIWNADGAYLAYARTDRRCVAVGFSDCKDTVIQNMKTGEVIIIPLELYSMQWVRIP